MRGYFVVALLAGVAVVGLAGRTWARTFAYVFYAYHPRFSVIDTASDSVVTPPLALDNSPNAVAFSPDGRRAYVATGHGLSAGHVWVIDTTTNTLIGAPITVGATPLGIAVTPDGRKAYVANDNDGTISVIDTATDTVAHTITTNPLLGDTFASIAITNR